MTEEYEGDQAKALIESQIAEHTGGIVRALAKYEPLDTVEKLHRTIRAIEEFINLPLFGVESSELFSDILAFPLDGRLFGARETLTRVRLELAKQFGDKCAGRFVTTIIQLAAVGTAFQQHGQTEFGEGIRLDTVGNAIAYLQSRRRHIVSMLYTVPAACRGDTRMSELDVFNVFLPVVEHSAVSLTSLHHMAVLADIFPDFKIRPDGAIFHGNRRFQHLDAYFLDPERASVVTMAQLGFEQSDSMKEAVDPSKIFSAEELRNSIKMLNAAYAEFGLIDTDFAMLADLVVQCSRFCKDDYFISIPKADFRRLLAVKSGIGVDRLVTLLVNKPSDYVTNTNAFEPFLDMGSHVQSSVNLLSRFLYNYKSFRLDAKRRFQIRTGFIFEAELKKLLADLGFAVTGIKRVNRKEFDVVAVRNGTIFNFQCKNNWIDLRKVEEDRARFVRYNRYLVSYYKRALSKERSREGLLTAKLGLGAIEHFIVSRFPVISEDRNIIPWNVMTGLSASDIANIGGSQ